MTWILLVDADFSSSFPKHLRSVLFEFIECRVFRDVAVICFTAYVKVGINFLICVVR